MDKRAAILKPLKSNLIAMAILLTILTVLKILNLDIITEFTEIAAMRKKGAAIITLLIRATPVFMLVLTSIGTWKMAFGRASGGDLVSFTRNFFKVLSYIGIGIMGLIAVIIIFISMRKDYITLGDTITVLLPEIIVAALLFFIVYFNKHIVHCVDDIQKRMTLPGYDSTSILRSPISLLLTLLGILNLLPLILTLLALLDGAGIFMTIMSDAVEYTTYPVTMLNALVTKSVYVPELSEIIQDVLASYLGSFGISIFSSIIMFYGAIVMKVYSKKVLQQSL